MPTDKKTPRLMSIWELSRHLGRKYDTMHQFIKRHWKNLPKPEYRRRYGPGPKWTALYSVAAVAKIPYGNGREIKVPPGMLSVADAAVLLGCGESAVRTALLKGSLKGVRVDSPTGRGGRWFVSPQAVAEFAKSPFRPRARAQRVAAREAAGRDGVIEKPLICADWGPCLFARRALWEKNNRKLRIA